MHPNVHRHTHTHTHPNEQLSALDCNGLCGVAFLTDRLEGDTYDLRSKVQAILLNYLVDLLVQKLESAAVPDAAGGIDVSALPDVSVMPDVSENVCSGELNFQDIEVLRQLLPLIVVDKIGVYYEMWFKTFANGIGQAEFTKKYGLRGGSEKLFGELFTGASIAEFLNGCLNDVDVSMLREEVRAEAKTLLEQCKS